MITHSIIDNVGDLRPNDRLAATLGSRSNLRKLSKKEVNSVNLVRACEYVTSPPEPLALRLTSNLMIGITRVYNQQYHFYYADVNCVWNRLHKTLLELQSESVDMIVPQARSEAITLEDDPFFEIEMTFSHKPQDFSVVPDIDETINGTQQSPIAPARASGSSNITRQSLITLPEISDVDLSVSSISGFSGGFDAGFGINDDLLMMDDNGIRIDFDEEGGLHEFELRPDGQDENNQQNGRDPVNSDMNEVMKRVREEHDAGLQENNKDKRRIRQKDPVIGDQNLDDEQVADVPMDIERESVQEVLQQITHDDQEVLQQTTHDGQEVPQQTTHNDDQEVLQQTTNGDQQAPDLEINAVEPRRQKKRRLYYMYDENTEMTNEQIIAMRDGVVDDLEEGERIAKDKAKMQGYKDLWRRTLYTPGLPLKAPQLSTFWSLYCAPMLQDNIVKQRIARPAFVPQHTNLDEFDDLYADVEDLGIGGSRQRENDYSFQGIELEHLRKAGSQSNSAITGLNSTGTEVPDLLDFDAASSAGNISRDILEFSGQLGRPSSIGLQRPSISMSENFPLFDDNIEIPDFQIFGELEEDNSMSGSSARGRYRDSNLKSNINNEQEQLNFLEFVKDLMQKAEVSSVIFHDIMVAQHVKRAETAKAFYNILGLATKNLIKVKQVQPYSDIVIELKE
ncbi:meiotic cohesin complex subunit Rec8 [Gigaspora margarita]|uniref:Meiotic cohesin complex subunit Rec8 n=1 Tax=Gigaspora margarita TaxID=4874 RepID=A0A8H3X8W2_GIGMA|nr:meiotic cohesin complex subunit Rec8 [Gigaspora margarita]